MNFFKKWFYKPKLKPKVYDAKSQGFNIEEVDKNALTVLHGLDQSGYDAYLVGGVIRDFLMGIESKDCDVVTNARPEKIVKRIKGSIIIGRRFKIVHARFGRQIIEVSTFRSNSGHVSSKGIIKRDNVYGRIEEDVMRRDFTVNALYYRYHDRQILDFVGGLEDLRNKKLRVIGDPLDRFPEDPVRMLRAIRFAAKLELDIEKDILEAIQVHKGLLGEISGQRLLAEIVKIYYSGHAKRANALLNDLGLLEEMIPSVSTLNKKVEAKTLWDTMATNADKRFSEGKRLSVTYLFACLFWPMFLEKMIKFKMKRFSVKVANQVLSESNIDIPFRIKESVFEVWKNQYAFKLKDKAPSSVYKSKRLRASYELLCQRAMIDSKLAEVAMFWADHV